MNRIDATERFYALVWPHSAALVRAARCLARDPAEADDIAQETMIKAFKSIDRFQNGTNMFAWLMTILRNTRIDRIRASASSKANVSLDQLVVDPADQSAETSDETTWHDPQAMLEQFADDQILDALHILPEEIRWTLLLVDVQGMDHDQAAEIMDVPVGTVKSRAFRGRAMLRQTLLPVAREKRLVK